jgi:hypothetical protein
MTCTILFAQTTLGHATLIKTVPGATGMPAALSP